ncbi:ankyrin repeat domain-containing protein [Mucilaginibacter myungsuensis]|uniref:Ankyrin repeat domain-containing protein n=1 Tax=Mucilaginibacter myungsuensis TaxID=649104 RepID=A0A929PY59_9SPHI|nr:ankyrin repeat domain-containing protein [Mucilaginibacter myungsuensis]MBE9663891.1 ankyrin repeat domain-containing protein [Mucilaginibacter myungsuensis]MDN3598393.1 ankyrin repeat domain-containing protein [Mucilaginibacter myungsuensis]
MNTDHLEELIAAGDTAALTALLQGNRALASAPTSHGVSPLMLSCYYKKPEASAVLLKFVDEVNLFEAAAVGKFDVVAYIVGTHPDSVNDFAPDGFTPLGLACYFGQAEVARYLVLKGAEVNLPSNNGFNVFPLHSATAGNFTDIARMLVANGAEVNVVQKSGVTPLHSAAQNGNADMLILLLEKGADVGIRMEGGKLPADLARDKGFNEIAEILS